MVKKSSIFTRIADRFRTGGVTVDGEHAVDADPANATVERIEGEVDVPSSRVETKPARKLSDREEALVALGAHFQELTALLRSSGARTDERLVQLVERTAHLEPLPGMTQQQVEALRGLSLQMERQNMLGEQIARSLQALPDMLSSVQQALRRAAQTNEQTSATMIEFQGAMDRVQSSVARMAESSEQQAKASQSLAEQRAESMRAISEEMEAAHEQSVRILRTAAEDNLDSLRQSNEDQSNRLVRLVQEHATWNHAMLFVLGVLALGMVALLVVQLVR